MKIAFFVTALAAVLLLSSCAPPPPPAGPQSCHCSMTTIIFFDLGVAAVTSKNLVAVRQAESFYARQVPHPIIIAGGADTAEIAANPRISLQRAESVAAQFEADGIPAQNLIIRDNGTAHLMIPTGIGVPQTMNRYVMTRIQVEPITAAAPPPSGPYQMSSIALYQPNPVLVARLGPDGAQALAAYIGEINASIARIFANMPAQAGVSGALVMGLKPDHKVRSWIVVPPGALSPALVAQIQSAVQSVTPVPVQGGPVAFAILFNAWGGGAPLTNAQHPLPMPPEWLAGAGGPESVPDGVFARIWP